MWRARRAEELVVGAPPAAERFRTAIEAELEAARPLRNNGYKVGLAADVVVDVLLGLTGLAERS